MNITHNMKTNWIWFTEETSIKAEGLSEITVFVVCGCCKTPLCIQLLLSGVDSAKLRLLSTQWE